MNKHLRHCVPGALRVLIVTVTLLLVVGPAISGAAAFRPDCDAPCCAPIAPEPVHQGHGAMAPAAMAADCCHTSPDVPCDLSQAPVQAPTVAVLKTRSNSPAPHAVVGMVQPLSPRFRVQVSRLLPKSASDPLSFTPLFLLKNALLC